MHRKPKDATMQTLPLVTGSTGSCRHDNRRCHEEGIIGQLTSQLTAYLLEYIVFIPWGISPESCPNVNYCLRNSISKENPNSATTIDMESGTF